ncbi:MAG: RNA pseudouridine synthase, partial [Nannocystaceae bacterium]
GSLRPPRPRYKEEGRRAVGEGGQEAWTEFRVRGRDDESALLEVVPHSGRTNQIRVHLASEHLPIVGDEAYGAARTMKSGTARLCLHAWRLSFEHPSTSQRLTFEALLPPWSVI